MKKYYLIVIALVLLSVYSCKDSTQLNVNNNPTAVFNFSPVNIDTTTVVTFNSTGSSDPEDGQNLLRYSWDFEGDMDWTEIVTNKEMSHKYTEPGTYTVTLKVFDTQGWSGETQQTVIVNDSI